MSALPPRQYRIVAIETRTLVGFAEARSRCQAERLAAKSWDEHGDENFKIKECSFEVVIVE